MQLCGKRVLIVGLERVLVVNATSTGYSDTCIKLATWGAGGGPMELEGLIFTDPGSVAPYLMHLVGSPQTHLPASGLVAALQLSSADARCAAAEALQAIVLAFGPRVDLAQVRHPYQAP